jgi:hypothetical protein
MKHIFKMVLSCDVGIYREYNKRVTGVLEQGYPSAGNLGHPQVFHYAQSTRKATQGCNLVLS